MKHMQILLSVIMTLYLVGCVSTGVQTREEPQALRVQENANTNEFEVCDPSSGAWKCEQFSKKTSALAGVDGNVSFDRQCLEKNYELGPIIGTFISQIEFENQGEYFLTNQQFKRLSRLAKHLKRGQIIVLGFTDKSGSETVNQILADQRAGQVSEALQKLGLSKEMISVEGQASQCVYPDINNRRVLIFEA